MGKRCIVALTEELETVGKRYTIDLTGGTVGKRRIVDLTGKIETMDKRLDKRLFRIRDCGQEIYC